MDGRAPQTLPMVWPEPGLRPMTGAVELALAEACSGEGRALSRPARASRVIAAVFDRLDGQAMTPDLVRALGSGVRAWLLCRAALVAGQERGWYQAECAACGALYDFPLRLADMPRGAAGPGYPVVEVETSLGHRRFEAPNGAHEEAIAARNTSDPRRALVALMGLAGSAESDALAFTEPDLARIEAALDDAMPDIGDQVSATCPACGATTGAVVDPLAFAFPRPDEVLFETHLIARAYGWREGAILALPSPRRRAYARMIASDSARMTGRGGPR